MSKEIIYEEGSKNVFADIRVRKPEEALLRAQLAKRLAEVIKKRGLTQTDIGRILSVDQPKVSKLTRGRISGFTSDRLFRFLSALGCDVRIEVKEKLARGRRGKLEVVAA